MQEKNQVKAEESNLPERLQRKGKALGETSAHYNADKYRRLVEYTSDEGLKHYMQVELESIIKNVEDPESKTFVDLGAGYGRIVPHIAQKVRNILAIEFSPEMFEELSRVSSVYQNCMPIFGDVHNLRKLLEGQAVQKPVFLLLQNTLAVINEPKSFLAELSSIAKELEGEVIISLFRQGALMDWGVGMYATIKEMVGEPDLDKIDFENGLFVSKTGYVSKWWTDKEIDELKAYIDGEVIEEAIEPSFYILHIKIKNPI